MIRLHTEVCCSPPFRLQRADDVSADAGDLSALNVRVVQTDNSHCTSVTSVAGMQEAQRTRERSLLFINKA